MDARTATAVFPGYAVAFERLYLIPDFLRQFSGSQHLKTVGKRILLPIPFRNVPGLTALFWDIGGRLLRCSDMYMVEKLLSYPSVFSIIPTHPPVNAIPGARLSTVPDHNCTPHVLIFAVQLLLTAIPHIPLKYSS